ncbi:MAG: hypothetical protein ACLQVI_04565 [Polyangiaceae bacterium]|jgi:hypothetical protein
MPDPKHSPREQGTPAPQGVSSYIRSHDSHDVAVPPSPSPLGAEADGERQGAEAFLEDWALRHFTISVKMHDVGRVSEDDPERLLVLEDLGFVQGILLELHDFASTEPRVHAMMDREQILQNGVSALYSWLDEVLDAASRLRVTRGKPSFVDAPGDEAFNAILRALERVHPDLETLTRVDAGLGDDDVAHKLALCFRQIGAAVVRVSGRAVSSHPPR